MNAPSQMPKHDAPGTWAIVTGASSGLGAEFARQLARSGRDVVLVARRKDRLEALATELGAMGRKAHVVELDLLEPTSVDQLTAEVDRLGLDVSLLVNNAGVGLHGETIDLDRARVMRMVDLNVRVLTELAVVFATRLAKRGGGAILNVASTAAFQPVPHFGAYAATKSYVTNFSLALARELAPKKVNVMVLCPGPTRTEFMSAGDMEFPGAEALFMDADRCVELALRALERNRSLIVTGWLNVIVAYFSRIAPLWLSSRIAGLVFTPKAKPTKPNA